MKRILLFVTVVLIVFGSLLPFMWFLDTSLKTERSITAIPPVLFPSCSTEFYRTSLERYSLLHYVKNSVIIASGTTFVTLALSIFAGYSLSRLRIRYKGLIMGCLLTVSMFPQISIAGPVWRIMHSLNWLNTYQGLIIPYVTLTLPLGIWITASFFKDLPVEIEDAARVDGCGHFQTLFRIMLPLGGPGIFTAAILIFIYAWNEFFFALLIMTEQGVQTLPVGIALFQGQYTMPWGEIAAASTVATIPVVIIVFFFQKKIVSGLSAGALKG
jgi:trehalose/maltose transport system permease protein